MRVGTTGRLDVLQIAVRDVLDSAEVEKIERVLASVGAGTKVILDFHGVRSFEPAPLVRLALALRSLDVRVSLRGLSEVHYRLLRHAGVPQPPVAPASPGQDGP